MTTGYHPMPVVVMELCKLCGAAVVNTAVHSDWHRELMLATGQLT